jgi:hypothetical protein
VGDAALGRLDEEQLLAVDLVAGEVLHHLEVGVEVAGDLLGLEDELGVLGGAGAGVAGETLGAQRRLPDLSRKNSVVGTQVESLSSPHPERPREAPALNRVTSAVLVTRLLVRVGCERDIIRLPSKIGFMPPLRR